MHQKQDLSELVVPEEPRQAGSHEGERFIECSTPDGYHPLSVVLPDSTNLVVVIHNITVFVTLYDR